MIFEGINKAEMTLTMRNMEIFFIVIQLLIVNIFLFILLICLRSLLIWQVQPAKFEDESYETIAKMILKILSVGLIVMILPIP
jgi:hypothetical protein